jgi:hypothetical protein
MEENFNLTALSIFQSNEAGYEYPPAQHNKTLHKLFLRRIQNSFLSGQQDNSMSLTPVPLTTKQSAG